MIQVHVRVATLLASVLLMTASGNTWAQDFSFSPNNLVISRSVYTGGPSTVTVGQTLPPGCVPGTVTLPTLTGGTTKVTVTCATANNDGTYPTIFNNANVDGSFGVTGPIFLDHMTTGGGLINTLPIDPTQIVTSFDSKSEMALNKSLDGQSLTFVAYVGGPGYATGPNQLDVSNSNTPGLVDPTNPVVSQYYRAVGEVDAFGNLTITHGNAYSGDNGRAAIKANNLYYMTGNDNNGGLSKTQLLDTQVGSNLITSTGAELLVPGQTPPVPPNIAQIGDFNITQLGYAADKAGKDNNFRGLTIFNNTLYVSKGSGSNGINTVYQVGSPGVLPTPSSAPGGDLSNVPITILPGFPTTLANTANETSSNPVAYPFGLFFANANTLYVCDEGDGVLVSPPVNGYVADASALATAGLQKWSLVNGTWQMDYVLQNGLNIGVPYNVPNTPSGAVPYPMPATDGCRNITGRVNTDGTVNIWAITSTVSSNADPAADPNELVFVTDNLASTTLPAGEQFAVLETAGYEEVLRGVSFAPGTIASALTSGTACNGVYDATFQGNVTVSAGQSCVFVGGAIEGNVQLNGGNLSLTNTIVTGNVQLQGGGTFSIGPSATVNGNLQIQNIPAGAAQNQVCDTEIKGNLQFQNNGTAVDIGSASSTCTGNGIGGDLQVQNNSAAVTAIGNTVGGNLQVSNNTADTTVNDNTVNGNLQDNNNSAPTTVFDNTVSNNLQCQNNSSITGGGNTAQQKQGQCSSF
jgi:hypothetical protein